MEDELELIDATYPSSMEVDGTSWRLSFSPCVNAGLYYEGGFCGVVRYLPPISLSGELPEEYPSSGMPFLLEASFLSQETIEDLRCRLEDISQNSISMVFFDWLTFLANDVQDLLGDKIRIPAEPLAYQLLAFDKKRELEQFTQELHICNICFDEKPGSRFTHLNCREQRGEGISHYFCTDCLQSLAIVHVDEGELHSLKCPDTECKVPLPEYVLRAILDKDRYDRWERLVTSRAIGQMSDIVYCPACSSRSREVPVLTEEDNLGRCFQCSYTFCGLCLQPYHPGTECISPTDAALQRRGGTAEEKQRIVNELLNVRYLTANKDFRSCPSCKMKVEKISGCNKMQCGYCGAKFCWKCEKQILGYDHFQGACVLFEDDVIRNWERNWNRQVVEQQVQQQVLYPGQPTAQCPRCHAHTMHANNNNIRCWNCQRSFCALCRKIYETFSTHFKPKGNCPQHGSL